MPFFRLVKSKRRRKRYDKVSHKVKIQLLKRVLCDHKEIKKTADDLEINYSTAKTFMRKYYRFGNQMDFQVLKGISRWYQEYQKNDRQRCTYRDLEDPDLNVKIQEISREEQGEVQGELNRYQGIWQNQGHKIKLFQQVLFLN